MGLKLFPYLCSNPPPGSHVNLSLEPHLSSSTFLFISVVRGSQVGEFGKWVCVAAAGEKKVDVAAFVAGRADVSKGRVVIALVVFR